MIKVAAYTAVAMAAALLGLQIIGGLEYTEGGSLYTRASMIAAMVTLAALPVFIEAARSLKAWGLVAALGVSFVAFLAYSLPATTGRTGEIKETNVVDQAKSLEDQARIRADHARTLELVDESNRWQLKACKGGNGKDCKAATFILNQRQASLEKLTKQLDDAAPVKAGDLGSDIVAWALSPVATVEASTVRKSSVLSFAIGLDIVIWSLVWFAGVAFKEVYGTKEAVKVEAPAVKAITERPEGDLKDEEIEGLRRLYSKANRPLTNDEVAAKLGVSKAESSKRIQKAVSAGVLSKQRSGREVAVRLLN